MRRDSFGDSFNTLFLVILDPLVACNSNRAWSCLDPAAHLGHLTNGSPNWLSPETPLPRVPSSGLPVVSGPNIYTIVAISSSSCLTKPLHAPVQTYYQATHLIQTMPRSRGRSAPASRPAPQQSRSAHTMSAPAPSHQQTYTPQAAPPVAAQQQRQPGLFSQMAATAGGVAVGSAVGHTLANGVSAIFGGGSSAAPVDQAQAAPAQAYEQRAAATCDVDAKNFTKCLDENNGNMQICDWYLQQLKSCQEAARPY